MKSIVFAILLISALGISSCNQSDIEAMKFYERGNTEMKAGNLINSLIYYNKAISLDSTQADIFMARGNARLTSVDYKGAALDFTKVIQLEPGRAEAYLLRATIRIYKKEFTDDAIADLEKAIQLKPDLAKAYYNLGVIKFVRNDRDGACSEWNKAAKLGYEPAALYLSQHCKKK